jgi:hypothetical protein
LNGDCGFATGISEEVVKERDMQHETGKVIKIILFQCTHTVCMDFILREGYGIKFCMKLIAVIFHNNY